MGSDLEKIYLKVTPIFTSSRSIFLKTEHLFEKYYFTISTYFCSRIHFIRFCHNYCCILPILLVSFCVLQRTFNSTAALNALNYLPVFKLSFESPQFSTNCTNYRSGKRFAITITGRPLFSVDGNVGVNCRGKIKPPWPPQPRLDSRFECRDLHGQADGRRRKRGTVPVNKLLRFVGFHGEFVSTKYIRTPVPRE